jgi:hypothetical protein
MFGKPALLDGPADANSVQDNSGFGMESMRPHVNETHIDLATVTRWPAI